MKKLINIVIIFLLLISCSSENKSTDREFFVFEPDIRLFTSYAFMNAAGFNHDWNDTMHPIRVEIRNYLDSILTVEYKQEISAFYKKAGGGDFYGYGVYALNSKLPPDFGLMCDTCKNEDFTKFVGYSDLLTEFYEKADIASIWFKYKGKLRERNIQYKPYAEIALKQITDYCRVDSNFYHDVAKGNFYFQQIPLMSYFTAFMHETGNDYWVVNGPSDGEPGPGAFYHESLHKIINPIVESNSEKNKKIMSLVNLSQEKLEGNYNSGTALLCESFVRTIDRILFSRYYNYTNDKLHEIIENEYKLGHILSFYLLENLPNYESSGKTLEQYYPELISNIDVKHEELRWRNYWKTEKEE